MWLPSHHLLFSSLHLLICLYLHPLVFALCLSLFSSVCCGWEWASSSVGAWLPVKANPGQGRRCYPTFHIQDKALNKYHWPVLERVKELCTLSAIQIRNQHTYSSVKTCFFFQSECPPWQSMNLQHLLQHELAAVVTAYWQNSSLGLAQPAALCLHLVFTPLHLVHQSIHVMCELGKVSDVPLILPPTPNKRQILYTTSSWVSDVAAVPLPAVAA